MTKEKASCLSLSQTLSLVQLTGSSEEEAPVGTSENPGVAPPGAHIFPLMAQPWCTQASPGKSYSGWNSHSEFSRLTFVQVHIPSPHQPFQTQESSETQKLFSKFVANTLKIIKAFKKKSLPHSV